MCDHITTGKNRNIHFLQTQQIPVKISLWKTPHSCRSLLLRIPARGIHTRNSAIYLAVSAHVCIREYIRKKHPSLRQVTFPERGTCYTGGDRGDWLCPACDGMYSESHLSPASVQPWHSPAPKVRIYGSLPFRHLCLLDWYTGEGKGTIFEWSSKHGSGIWIFSAKMN